MTSKNNFYTENLLKFLTNKGETYTHTRIANKNLAIQGGIFNIERENEELFLKNYISNVFIKGNMEYLTEKQLIENGPLLIDIDLRYSSEIQTRQHTINHIIDLIMIYANKISSIFKIPDNQLIPVYVMEKNCVNIQDNITKDGIHIILGIKMHKAIQVILRELVLKDLLTIWDDLKIINDIEEVIDIGITKGFVNWQLYGSRKPGNKAYLIKNIFKLNYDKSEDDWTIMEDDVKEFKIEEDFIKLSARNTNWTEFPLQEAKKEEIELSINNFYNKKINKNFKSILSVKKIINNQYNYSLINNAETLEEYLLNFFEEINTSTDYVLKETHEFCLILPETYYEKGSYNKWIRVGWALKNTSSRLFLTWLKFSSQAKDFDFKEVHNLYDQWEQFDTYNVDGLTSRSIMFWARNEFFTEYKKIRQETISFYIDETIKAATEWDLANVLYQIYKDEFVCVIKVIGTVALYSPNDFVIKSTNFDFPLHPEPV